VSQPQPPARPLVEGVDYIIENGRWVFTREFLLRRGYCCQSGCRHCPYGYTKPTAPAAQQRPTGK
jgi:hypothetical protein